MARTVPRHTIPPDLSATPRAHLGTWRTLFGLISLELVGHTHDVITEHESFFTRHVDALADAFGL